MRAQSVRRSTQSMHAMQRKAAAIPPTDESSADCTAMYIPITEDASLLRLGALVFLCLSRRDSRWTSCTPRAGSTGLKGTCQDRLGHASYALSASKPVATMQGCMQGSMQGFARQVFTMLHSMEHGLNAEGLFGTRGCCFCVSKMIL